MCLIALSDKYFKLFIVAFQYSSFLLEILTNHRFLIIVLILYKFQTKLCLLSYQRQRRTNTIVMTNAALFWKMVLKSFMHKMLYFLLAELFWYLTGNILGIEVSCGRPVDDMQMTCRQHADDLQMTRE